MTQQAMKMGILNNMALLSHKLSMWQSYLQTEKEGWKYKYQQKIVQRLLGKNWEVENRGRDNPCRMLYYHNSKREDYIIGTNNTHFTTDGEGAIRTIRNGRTSTTFDLKFYDQLKKQKQWKYSQ